MQKFARAAIFHGPGQPFEMRSLEVRAPRDAEILVRVTCCTICGSDLHTCNGRRTVATPTILGHEIIGRIEALGPKAPRVDLLDQPLREGDRITWTVAASCGRCFYCLHDLPQKCERLFKYGHEPIHDQHPLNGGLAEFCLLAEGTGIARLPDTLPDFAACPANCATATVAGALRAAGDCRDRTILIQGAGMLGLTACAMASVTGAAAVICCDVDNDRLRRAKQFGATHTVLAEPTTLNECVQTITDGRGVDLALELSGSSQAIESGLPLLRIGGQYLWLGAVFPVPAISILPEMIVRRQLRIQGLHNYAPRDLAAAVRFLTEQHQNFPLADLVSRSFALEDTERAFRAAHAESAVRVAIKP